MKKALISFCVMAVTLALCVSCDKPVYDYFGGIHGTVTDLGSGAPIPNASVTLSPGGANDFTGLNGHYQFINLEPGQYFINIQHSDYRPDRKSVTVRVGESVAVNFSLTAE
jgi:hypothetical protein